MISFNRRIQFLRSIDQHDGYQMVGVPANHGSPIWASRKDISDGERVAAGWIEATVAARFVVQRTRFTADIKATDFVDHGGKRWDITGIKELGLAFFEITAIARADR